VLGQVGGAFWHKNWRTPSTHPPCLRCSPRYSIWPC